LLILKSAGETSDPRHVFYKAMLDYHTYEKYLEEGGDLKVDVPTFEAGRFLDVVRFYMRGGTVGFLMNRWAGGTFTDLIKSIEARVTFRLPSSVQTQVNRSCCHRISLLSLLQPLRGHY
jgi:hypothetical protein